MNATRRHVWGAWLLVLIAASSGLAEYPSVTTQVAANVDIEVGVALGKAQYLGFTFTPPDGYVFKTDGTHFPTGNWELSEVSWSRSSSVSGGATAVSGQLHKVDSNNPEFAPFFIGTLIPTTPGGPGSLPTWAVNLVRTDSDTTSLYIRADKSDYRSGDTQCSYLITGDNLPNDLNIKIDGEENNSLYTITGPINGEKKKEFKIEVAQSGNMGTIGHHEVKPSKTSDGMHVTTSNLYVVDVDLTIYDRDGDPVAESDELVTNPKAKARFYPGEATALRYRVIPSMPGTASLQAGGDVQFFEDAEMTTPADVSQLPIGGEGTVFVRSSPRTTNFNLFGDTATTYPSPQSVTITLRFVPADAPQDTEFTDSVVMSVEPLQFSHSNTCLVSGQGSDSIRGTKILVDNPIGKMLYWEIFPESKCQGSLGSQTTTQPGDNDFTANVLQPTIVNGVDTTTGDYALLGVRLKDANGLLLGTVRVAVVYATVTPTQAIIANVLDGDDARTVTAVGAWTPAVKVPGVDSNPISWKPLAADPQLPQIDLIGGPDETVSGKVSQKYRAQQETVVGKRPLELVWYGNTETVVTCPLYTCLLRLDIDSLNRRGASLPARSEEERAAHLATPGKVIFANINDDDNDGVPDYADWAVGAYDACDTSEVSFVPAILEFRVPSDICKDVKLTFDYAGPRSAIGVNGTHFGGTPVFGDEAQSRGYKDYTAIKSGHTLRLWTQLAAESGRAESSLVNAGKPYLPEELGMPAASSTSTDFVHTFYIEAVSAAGGSQFGVKAQVQDDPTGTDRKYAITVTSVSGSLGVNCNNSGTMRAGVPDSAFVIDENDWMIKDQAQAAEFWYSRDLGKVSLLGVTDLFPILVDIPDATINAGYSAISLRAERLDGDGILSLSAAPSNDGNNRVHILNANRASQQQALAQAELELSRNLTPLPIHGSGEKLFMIRCRPPESDWRAPTTFKLTLVADNGAAIFPVDSLMVRFVDIRKCFAMVSTRGVTSSSPGFDYPLEDGRTQSISVYPTVSDVATHYDPSLGSGAWMGAGKSQWIVALHGYNVSMDDAEYELGEVFKRLYWTGYRGNFVGFTWEGNEFTAGPACLFAQNVENAFQTAPRLLQFIRDVVINRWHADPNDITLWAHSLGNQVALETLRMNNHYYGDRLVNSYISVEPALWAETFWPKASVIYNRGSTDTDCPPLLSPVSHLGKASWGFWYTQNTYMPTQSANNYVHSYNADDFALWAMIVDDFSLRNPMSDLAVDDIRLSDGSNTTECGPRALYGGTRNMSHQCPAMLNPTGIYRIDASFHHYLYQDCERCLGMQAHPYVGHGIVSIDAKVNGWDQWSHNGHKGGSDKDVSPINDSRTSLEYAIYKLANGATRPVTTTGQIFGWIDTVVGNANVATGKE